MKLWPVQTVIRGGPDVSPVGNDLAHLASSTFLGAERYGHIGVLMAPYVPPFKSAIQFQQDGAEISIPLELVNPNDPMLERDESGRIKEYQNVAPDWPRQGEVHERRILWQGSDEELRSKLSVAWTAGQQINAAQLEYAPLYNNSNGVVRTLLVAADITPALPFGADGQEIDAPGFESELHQDIGIASRRSGYRFDGKHWYDDEDREILPPTSGAPTVPLNPDDQHRTQPGSFNSSQIDPRSRARAGDPDFTTGDPQLDQLAAALRADDDAAFSQIAAIIADSEEVRGYERLGRDLVATQEHALLDQRTPLQQQEPGPKIQSPALRM